MKNSCPNESFDSDPNAPDLLKCIQGGEMIAFIGSGLSCVVGYPAWHILVEDMRIKCGVQHPHALNEDTGADLLQKIAQLAKESDRDAYVDVLENAFAQTVKSIPGVYHALLNTEFAAYCTTNYDPLLAKAIAGWPGSNRRVYAYPEFHVRGLSGGNVVYLHGYIEEHGKPDPERLVLCLDDFDKAYNPEPQRRLIDMWSNIWNDFDILFIGCKLREPQMAAMLGQLCKLEQAQTRDCNIPPHRRFIMLPQEETETARELGISSKEANTYKRQAANAEYAKYGISVVRYDAKDKDHIGLTEVMSKWPSAPKPVVFSRTSEGVSYDR